jgi:hypothetical protein
MIAIKNDQEKIGEYLIANGIDFKYKAKFYVNILFFSDCFDV